MVEPGSSYGSGDNLVNRGHSDQKFGTVSHGEIIQQSVQNGPAPVLLQGSKKGTTF
jgi:hypothetical protein